MNKKDIADIYKAINRVSNRINEISEKLDTVMSILHLDSVEKITVNSDGIDGLAEIVSVYDGAIEDLAVLISESEGK